MVELPKNDTFRGTFEHSIDEKGRVSVPVRFREVLQVKKDECMVITNFFVGAARCLEVYPYSAWVELEKNLKLKGQFDQTVVQFMNYYISSALECTLDKQGRILLPPNLREHAGLKRDVVFTSALAKFRIWDRDQWRQVFAAAERELMARPAGLDGLGL